jgi:hypothetical protein
MLKEVIGSIPIESYKVTSHCCSWQLISPSIHKTREEGGIYGTLERYPSFLTLNAYVREGEGKLFL